VKKILITGGAGFIGSNLIRHLLDTTEYQIINVDKLTYASNLKSHSKIKNNNRYQFFPFDIAKPQQLAEAFSLSPDAVIHLASETHVDRSIEDAGAFIETNIVGTYHLLQQSRQLYQSLHGTRKSEFRFFHVSTDEVYGSLRSHDAPFSETTPYDPHSPYSASKASADHLVRAWHATYQLPVLISHSANNYGPFQHQEKFIPKIIVSALQLTHIPVYGDGTNIRDWINVADHITATMAILKNGRPGETYNISANYEQTNMEIALQVCRILDELYPISQNPRLASGSPNTGGPLASYEQLIRLVDDRPGHDFRYANDCSKLREELGWRPQYTHPASLTETVKWYVENQDCWRAP
jgi:dTDP-glucose 4,6-dehydratase